MDKILECIPNFSEGINNETLEKIAAAIGSVENVWLLHIDQSPAANRTVFTFAGQPESVVKAAFEAIKIAAENIDMRNQIGVHPRIGATDVCPLVPLYGMAMEEASNYALELGKRVGEELNIPVFLYENSQAQTHRKALPQIRKGQYEGLSEKIKLAEWKPDFGPAEMNESAGATVIGARDILVAFNISLNTKDVEIANWIASEMRAKSKSKNALPKLRAIGWYMADYGQAQVSFNLLDYKTTELITVWESCKKLALEKGVDVMGSEVIGLVPEICLLQAGNFALNNKSKSPDILLQAAIDYLGLSKLKAFDPEEKILEHTIAKHHISG